MNTKSVSTFEKKAVAISILAFYIICLALIFYSILGSLPANPNLSILLFNIGGFIGLLSFLLISFLIISGDTARFFDKYFGIDRIIKFQRKVAITTYFIVFTHPLFIILSGVYGINYLLPQFGALPLAFGALSLYIFIVIMVSSLNYKRVSYKVWQYLHIATYILFAFVIYHSIYTGTAINDLSIKIIYYILLIMVVIGIIYRTNYKLKQRKNNFFVKEIISETKDTYTLVLNPKTKVDFQPGQFFFLRLEGKKLYARHPFSVSSAPKEKDLSFTVKLAGRFTQEALKVKKGDEVKVEGPFGNFILPEKGKELVFIAGGVGITPFMSMIKHLKDIKSKIKVLLLYSSKTEKDIIFKSKLGKINESWLKKIYILSREEKKTKGYEIGRINQDILTKYIDNFKNKVFYICGPQEMNHSLKEALLSLGVKKENIIFEDFFW